MRTTLTRLLAGTAVAATAVLTVAGTAGATTTPPKAPTTLSIVLAENSITVGQSDVVSGALASSGTPLPGRIIELERFVPKTGHWNAFEEKKTGPKGGVSFLVKPVTTTAYRLFFAGGPKYQSTHSGVGIVVVSRVKTILSIEQTPNAAKHNDTISGQLTTVKGRDLGGQFVWLTKVVGTKLHFIKAFKTGKFGRVSFVVSPATTTTYELVFLGTKVLAGSTSGTVQDTVS